MILRLLDTPHHTIPYTTPELHLTLQYKKNRLSASKDDEVATTTLLALYLE